MSDSHEVSLSSGKDATFAIRALKRMLFIRAFERRCLDLSRNSPPQVMGSIHLCAGQEAVPVGAWALESGIPAVDLLAEICHRATGINGGRAGSAMVMSTAHRFLGENSIVGAGVPIACGSALASVVQGDGAVTIVSFGDGATSQGAFHEGLVFAVARNLPVIFVCENNGWSELSNTHEVLRTQHFSERVTGYGMSAVTVDGTDPLAVHMAVRIAAEDARKGHGPTFVECNVPRLWGHYNRDIQHYRSSEDKALAESQDPITNFGTRLIAIGVLLEPELHRMRDAVEEELNRVTEHVLASAHPDPTTATLHVVLSPYTVVPVSAVSVEPRELTYVQAVNEALRAELVANPQTIVYGEDVGASGGIFAASRNLQRDFGAQRVFDTPISEAAILGSAVGAALCGMRPIVEIMWGDFLMVALDQLVNQAANVRYITEGKTNVPMVVRFQQGATPGSCPQHSQCLEALLAHIPGLRVGLPATPQDAYDMIRAAANDPDPCVIIESRSLYQTKGLVRLNDKPAPIGGAKVLCKGGDGGIICWATTVAPALEAAAALKAFGKHIGVLDLRWLSPLNDDEIKIFVEDSNGRIIIVHEANTTGGFGAEVVARIAESGIRLQSLIRRLGAADCRIPAASILQSAVLPTTEEIIEALRAMLEI
jgi:2-oxoisovalerate dehydrogenase E1 component